ncbi:MAG: hypothetical protein U1G07_02520 [Verrucomicrobiota bacterium]
MSLGFHARRRAGLGGLLGLIALGLWWSSNTIAHQFIHRRFFRRTGLNRAFSLWLERGAGHPSTALAGAAPGAPRRTAVAFCPSGQLLVESLCVGTLWLALTWLLPAFFGTYLPGWCAHKATMATMNTPPAPRVITELCCLALLQ